MADPSIQVDPDGLTEFASNVGFYATEVDPAEVSRSREQFAQGVTFGVKNASGAVHVAKENYARALAASLANLSEFVEAAKILADAAEKAAADFRAVDGRSADTIEAVNAKLLEASQRADVARNTFGPFVPEGRQP